VRLHELAKELNADSKRLLAIGKELGLPGIKSASSNVEPGLIGILRAAWAEELEEIAAKEAKKAAKAKKAAEDKAAEEAAAAPPPEPPAPAPELPTPAAVPARAGRWRRPAAAGRGTRRRPRPPSRRAPSAAPTAARAAPSRGRLRAPRRAAQA
jgi:hypothetical protein